MLIANVIGTVTSTIKHASMERQKLLVIQPTMADGESPDGEPLVAIDCIGAGTGDRVILTSDSESTREFLGVTATPARWAVVGITD